MILTVGDKVIYPSRGPCVVGPVVRKVVEGRLISFYRFAFMDDSGGELFIPVDGAPAIGIRPLLVRSEIPKLLGCLKKAARTADDARASKNWRQRAVDNLKLFASGSAFDLAKIVESLTELSAVKALTPRERRTLEQARKLLVCEISEVMGEGKGAAEGRLDRALKA